MSGSDGRPPESLFSGYTGRNALLLAFGWMTILLGRQTLPPLLPAIIQDLSISPAEAGIALTVLWGLYAFNLYPGGRLSDQLSRKTVIVSGLVTMFLGFALLVVIDSYRGLLASVAFVGFGAGLYFIATRALLSDLFVVRRGQAFGIQAAAGSLGSMGAAAVAVGALAAGTWHAAFVPVLAFLAVVTVLMHRWNREPYVVKRVTMDVRGTARRAFRGETVRWLFVAYVMFAFSLQSVLSFLPTFLQAEKGFSPVLASAGFGLVYLVGTVAGPVGGRLGDRVPRVPVAAASLSVAAIGLAAMLLSAPTGMVLVGIVVFAAGLRSFPPVMQAYLMDVFPDESMGGDFGALKSVYTGIGSLGPTYVGFAVERTSYTTAFSTHVVLLLLGAAITLWVGRR